MHPTLRRAGARRLRSFAAGSAAFLLASVALVAGASPASASTLPVPYSVATAVAAGNLAPNTPPPGANDWSCQPSAAHPYPVVLVHATLTNERMDWDSLSPLLADNGYCVFTFNYGGDGIDPVNDAVEPIEDGAATLAAFVDQVLTATHIAKVDLVGHSQGGLMPRYYLKYLGGGPKTHSLVALAPTNHGGTVSGFATMVQYLKGLGLGAPYDLTDAVCPACNQQLVGSDFLADLNAGGDTVPGVNYTVIATKHDELASPYINDFLSGPNVTNITLQDGCPVDLTGHIDMAFRPRPLALVLNALDPQHPTFVPCLVQPFAG
ncbi:esterase/lipase family protein [Kitasatospora phosalacinea]|uniref:Esterase/lipase family protein n=1 Tax=Kitasatospora phosalacinea TaxID=2065 RepID=A0ABW6GJN7_9ACTN